MTNVLIEQYKKIHNMSDADYESFKSLTIKEPHDGSLFTDYDRFKEALNNLSTKEVTIHPDYDADGVFGGTTMLVGLEVLEVAKKVNLYAPNRENGYGLSVKAVDDILNTYPNTNVIITVDNGINTKEAVDYAVSKGLSVIVTDHHKPMEGFFPDKAEVVINPNRIDKKETYPFKGIAGTQVAWKLLLAYAKSEKPEKVWLIEKLLPFAGMSIISDVMPTTDENRLMLRQTVERLSDPINLQKNVLIKEAPDSFIKAFNGLLNVIDLLVEKGKLKSHTSVDYDTIGFSIAPMINASHRMKMTSQHAFDVFTTYDKEAVRYLYELNELRKEEVTKAVYAFNASVDRENLQSLRGIVYSDPNIRSGIAGLIASKIMEEYKVPVVALSGLGGSGRSPHTHNLFNILTNVEATDSEMFKSWGGHEQAAGVHLNKGKLETFKRLFNEKTIAYEKENGQIASVKQDKSIVIDPWDCPSWEVVLEAISEFNLLKPYSDEFVPAPIFKVSFDPDDVTIKYMGQLGNHVKFSFDDFEVIVWDGADKVRDLDVRKYHTITVVGQLGVNSWMNNKTVQLTSQHLVVDTKEKLT